MTELTLYNMFPKHSGHFSPIATGAFTAMRRLLPPRKKKIFQSYAESILKGGIEHYKSGHTLVISNVLSSTEPPSGFNDFPLSIKQHTQKVINAFEYIAEGLRPTGNFVPMEAILDARNCNETLQNCIDCAGNVATMNKSRLMADYFAPYYHLMEALILLHDDANKHTEPIHRHVVNAIVGHYDYWWKTDVQYHIESEQEQLVHEKLDVWVYLLTGSHI